MTNAFGIDTSHWDGKVNWQTAKQAGVSFGIFKLTDFYKDQPIGFEDTQAGNSWLGLRDNGLVSGAYCWLQPKQDPVLQARYYLNALAEYPTDMPPILDFEDRNVNTWNDMLWRGQRWLEYVEAETGKVPMVYTSSGYIGNFDKAKRSFLGRYPLWLAQYTWMQLPPSVPSPWTSWVLWQYSDKVDGKYYGAQSAGVDGNYFAGDSYAMRKYFGLDDVVVPDEPSDAEKLARLWEAHEELH
jgi:lysozyme